MKVKSRGISLGKYVTEHNDPCSDSLKQLREAMDQVVELIERERAWLKFVLKIPIGYERDPIFGKLKFRWCEIEIRRDSSRRLKRLENQRFLISDRIERALSVRATFPQE